MKLSTIKIWLQAFRLRTLPLALSNAVMGSFLALSIGAFRWSVFVFSILTITILQIISNLANDYGDAVSGADSYDRVGPQRVTQSGLVTQQAIKRMIAFFILLAVVFGSMLVYVGMRGMQNKQILLFLTLGLAAIVAALKYTIGKNPYGYRGLGDLFVFIFFGLVGVIGTFYLHTHVFHFIAIIPAIIIGLLSTGVLNINNIRDIDSDRESGKNTLVVKFGLRFARLYHITLVGSAMILSIVFTLHYSFSPWQWIFLITFPLFFRNCLRVYQNKNAEEINGELKNLALTTFLFSLLMGLGLVL
jgi:1,4-dihydroxy-2-naphthoate octaprenyltransferase